MNTSATLDGLIVTSHIQTARHKMASLSAVFTHVRRVVLSIDYGGFLLACEDLVGVVR